MYTFGERPVFHNATLINPQDYFFAIAFNLIVPFVLSGIIVGIITDTFGQLRSKSEEIRAAKQNYCYCCDHTHQELDESPMGFVGHNRFEHNVWDFVSFMIHIDTKFEKHKSLTGPEVYALQLKSQNQLIKMWPFEKAYSLDQAKSNDLRRAADAS